MIRTGQMTPRHYMFQWAATNPVTDSDVARVDRLIRHGFRVSGYDVYLAAPRGHPAVLGHVVVLHPPAIELEAQRLLLYTVSRANHSSALELSQCRLLIVRLGKGGYMAAQVQKCI